MMPTNKVVTIGENLNLIKEITGYTKIINDFDIDDPNGQSLIKNIEYHIKNGMEQQEATDISQNKNEVLKETLVKNNKKSNITNLNFYIPPPRNDAQKSFYVELKEYNGRVMKIGESKFTAELINIADENDKLKGDFDVSDIDKGDMGLFRVGALFVWKIGKEENNGTQQKVSQLTFRRLSSWRTVDIKRTEEIAKSRAAAIRAIAAEDPATAQ